jgi:purine-binding chemotaxis protein CheW
MAADFLAEVERGPMSGAVLTIRAGGETLALRMSEVTEVLQPRPLTRVPHAAPSLLGLVNLRGAVVPVLSLAALVGATASSATEASRLVLMWPRAPVALLVDAVIALADASEARQLDLHALLAKDFAGLLRRSAALGAATAAAQPDRALPGTDRALVSFLLAGQGYALPMADVAEIARLPAEFIALPQTDAAMLGVTALRGSVLPLVSLRVLLGLPGLVPDMAQARMVLIRLAGGLVGLVVDSVQSLLRVPETAIDPVPPVLTRGATEARVAAICRLEGGRRLISLLDTQQLLDRETAERVRSTVAGKAMAMASEAAESGVAEQFVLFHLGGEAYGLPIAAVEEVVRHPGALTRIPRAPDFLEGVMNLRGSVVPVIDQRRRFAAQGSAAAGRRRIIVVRLDGLLAGFAVDAVSEIVGINPAALTATPDLAADGGQIFDRVATSGRDGRMILIVDPQALLDQAERDLLIDLAEAAPGP